MTKFFATLLCLLPTVLMAGDFSPAAGELLAGPELESATTSPPNPADSVAEGAIPLLGLPAVSLSSSHGFVSSDSSIPSMPAAAESLFPYSPDADSNSTVATVSISTSSSASPLIYTLPGFPGSSAR